MTSWNWRALQGQAVYRPRTSRCDCVGPTNLEQTSALLDGIATGDGDASTDGVVNGRRSHLQTRKSQ
jgi:hypothetical protein